MKYTQFGVTYDVIFAHEIGHLIAAIFTGCEIALIEINEESRHVITKSDSSCLSAENLEDQFFRVVSGDIMQYLYVNKMKLKPDFSEKMRESSESSSVAEWGKLGAINFDEFIVKCANILLKNRHQFYYWLNIFLANSIDQELRISESECKRQAINLKSNELWPKICLLVYYRIKCQITTNKMKSLQS